MTAWADSVFEDLEAWAAPGVYANYLDDAADEDPREACGQNWERLVELKAKWDPDDLFHHNVNVPPGG